MMKWLIDEVFSQAVAIASELAPFRGDTDCALLPDGPCFLGSSDPLAVYRGSTTEPVGAGIVFDALFDLRCRLQAGLKRAEKELSDLPPAVSEEVKKLMQIENDALGIVGYADAGMYYANSELGVVGKRGCEAVIRFMKPLPFPLVGTESSQNQTLISVIRTDKGKSEQPSEGSNLQTLDEKLMDHPQEEEELSAYVPAKTLMDASSVIQNHNQLKKLLKENPRIRRCKPSKNRLRIHAGDWFNHWKKHDKRMFDLMDHSSLQGFLDEVEDRKEKIRNA